MFWKLNSNDSASNTTTFIIKAVFLFIIEAVVLTALSLLFNQKKDFMLILCEIL